MKLKFKSAHSIRRRHTKEPIDSSHPYNFASKETIEKKREETIADAKDAGRAIYQFNWDLKSIGRSFFLFPLTHFPASPFTHFDLCQLDVKMGRLAFRQHGHSASFLRCLSESILLFRRHIFAAHIKRSPGQVSR